MEYVEQFKVDSLSSPGKQYVVSCDANGAWQCSCVGWTRHVPRRDCQHITHVRRFGGIPIDPLLAAIAKAERKVARNNR